jgi:hypothetical protein
MHSHIALIFRVVVAGYLRSHATDGILNEGDGILLKRWHRPVDDAYAFLVREV